MSWLLKIGVSLATISRNIAGSHKVLKPDKNTKDSTECNFCNKYDNLLHFFYFVQRQMNVGILGQINIIDLNNLEECIIFGFPNNNDNTKVLNDCIILAKYHIYIQKRKFTRNYIFVFLSFVSNQVPRQKLYWNSSYAWVKHQSKQSE